MKAETIALVKRYRLFLALIITNIILFIVRPDLGAKSAKITTANVREMLIVIPPIFVLLGLLDVWVERKTMMKLIGSESGVKGMLVAFIWGSAAAGPLYAAFPIAVVMLRKGCSIFNIFIFIGAW